MRRQFAQEGDNLIGRASHLGSKRILGEIIEADETRRVVTQREDGLDVFAVIPISVIALV